WRYLKAHHLNGIGFRRQVPMKAYIADFLSHSARLIIEIDGESHDFETRRISDDKRDAWFGSQGYQVLRFTNEDVLKNLNGVAQAIVEACTRRTPLSAPPPQGGREPSNMDFNQNVHPSLRGNAKTTTSREVSMRSPRAQREKRP